VFLSIIGRQLVTKAKERGKRVEKRGIQREEKGMGRRRGVRSLCAFIEVKLRKEKVILSAEGGYTKSKWRAPELTYGEKKRTSWS